MVVDEMVSENVLGVGGRFSWRAHQLHPGLFERSPAFAVVAGWTGGDNISPYMLAAHMSRDDMIDRQFR